MPDDKQPPTWISEHEAAFSIGSSRQAFQRFIERNSIETFAIAGGRIMRRKDFNEAVQKVLNGAAA